MKYNNFKDSDDKISQVALGTMRIAQKNDAEVDVLLSTAYEKGINFIDTSPRYAGGRAEEAIGGFLENHKALRDRLYVQTKCGIEQGEHGTYFDSSYENIMKSVETSLIKLKTDYVDCLLIHKPDQLSDPEEIAKAFSELKRSGKVRHFGVSNHAKEQLQLLEKYCDSENIPLVTNQLKLSICNTRLIDGSFLVNTIYEQANDRSSGVLDYMRYHDIVLQAFSVIRSDRVGETFIDNPHHEKLNQVLDRLCEKYKTNKNALGLAWVLRHPARIQAIIGTASTERLDQYLDAFRYTLTREEWYELYVSAEKPLP